MLHKILAGVFFIGTIGAFLAACDAGSTKWGSDRHMVWWLATFLMFSAWLGS